jgi:hypothetical protein
VTPPAPSMLAAPSAAAAREALARALTDAPGEVRVSWWEDGRTAARDAHPGDVGPHWRGTLAQLAELIEAERSVTAAKGHGRAMCGAAVRQGADGWRRQRRALDGWALAQLDLDPPAAGAMRGEGEGPTVASVAAGLRALGIAAVAHPSPSARVGGGASTRVRVWVRVAEAGGPVRGDASARCTRWRRARHGPRRGPRRSSPRRRPREVFPGGPWVHGRRAPRGPRRS